MPALLRRRASAADRMALKAAFEAWPSPESVATVFCSRHGEVQRSVELMEMTARGEGQLPMSFSLSVHNAASGLFGISRGDRKASTSLAAGRDTLAMGVFEACMLLGQGEPKVLMVAFDDALPLPLQGFAEHGDAAAALALLLTPGSEFSLGRAEGADHGPHGPSQAAGLAAFLNSKESLLQSGGWAWRRNA